MMMMMMMMMVVVEEVELFEVWIKKMLTDGIYILENAE
jgi:hypothetical protein